MPDSQATPNTDDKISALEALVTKLAHKVDSMVSRTVMRRADSRRDDDDKRDDDRRDDDDDRKDDRRDDDDDKAKKDAARKTLFGGKRKDAKRDDDDKRDDAEPESEEWKEEEKEEPEHKADDRRDDAEEEEEKKGEPEPMASDDDRRKDRRKDAKRDDDDDRKDARRRDDDDDRKDARRRDDDDKRSDDRRDRSDDRRDDSRADSMIRSLQRELADLKRSVRRRVMSDDELNALSERQSDWDKVAQMHGQRASRPLDGESINSYDRRLAKTFQKYSDKWKSTDLADMPIEVVTKVIAPEIRADAIKAAYNSDPSPGAMQREIIKTDRTGRRISEFVGPVDAPNGMFKPFELPPLRFRGFNRTPNVF